MTTCPSEFLGTLCLPHPRSLSGWFSGSAQDFMLKVITYTVTSKLAFFLVVSSIDHTVFARGTKIGGCKEGKLLSPGGQMLSNEFQRAAEFQTE